MHDLENIRTKVRYHRVDRKTDQIYFKHHMTNHVIEIDDIIGQCVV